MYTRFNKINWELHTEIDLCDGGLDFQLSSTKDMIAFSRIIYDG